MLTCTEYWIINSFPKRKQTTSFKTISLLNMHAYISSNLHLIAGRFAFSILQHGNQIFLASRKLKMSLSFRRAKSVT